MLQVGQPLPGSNSAGVRFVPADGFKLAIFLCYIFHSRHYNPLIQAHIRGLGESAKKFMLYRHGASDKFEHPEAELSPYRPIFMRGCLLISCDVQTKHRGRFLQPRVVK